VSGVPVEEVSLFGASVDGIEPDPDSTAGSSADGAEAPVSGPTVVVVGACVTGDILARVGTLTVGAIALSVIVVLASAGHCLSTYTKVPLVPSVLHVQYAQSPRTEFWVMFNGEDRPGCEMLPLGWSDSRIWTSIGLLKLNTPVSITGGRG
jgi:hypothetical protein